LEGGTLKVLNITLSWWWMMEIEVN
jgi:hypothetical protein